MQFFLPQPTLLSSWLRPAEFTTFLLQIKEKRGHLGAKSHSDLGKSSGRPLWRALGPCY